MRAGPPQPRRLGRPLVWFAETTSTNDVACAIAEAGGPEGAVVVAETQTHGRGRLGRVWSSPSGGLWCSVLLRPTTNQPWGRLSLAVAVAVAEAIDAHAGTGVGIRWPNDLVVGDRKVCGVLLEGAAGCVIVGIGINVAVSLDHLPEDVAVRAASLHLIAPRRVEHRGLLAAVVDRLSVWYDAWAAGDPGVLAAWAARDVSRGRRIVAGAPGGETAGVAEGVDEDGALRIRRDDGTIARIVAGELHPHAIP